MQVTFSRGQGSIIEPFARQLEGVIADAVAFLSGFTKKGFFGKLLSSRKSQQKFNDIDQSVTAVLNDLTAALQVC